MCIRDRISTTLLIGLRPTALSLFLSHSGDSPIVTPLIVMPVYLGQSVVFSIITSYGLLLLSGLKSDNKGRIAFLSRPALRFRYAARSLATPKCDPLSILLGVSPISKTLS